MSANAANTITVTGIASTTTETALRDFFTFCGNITDIQVKDTQPKSAVIQFQKTSAAKTALMLDEGTLDGAKLSVTSESASHEDSTDNNHDTPFDQSDKPRAGIAAEYLAKGYVLSDSILQRAIEIDNKQGISKKFLDYWHSLDQTIGSKALGPDQTLSGKVQETVSSATQQAKAMDEQKGISKTAGSYYEKAFSSSIGQTVYAFYTSTTKQVTDIHEEAKRIAGQTDQVATTEHSTDSLQPNETVGQPTAPTTQHAPTVV